MTSLVIMDLGLVPSGVPMLRLLRDYESLRSFGLFTKDENLVQGRQFWTSGHSTSEDVSFLSVRTCLLGTKILMGRPLNCDRIFVFSRKALKFLLRILCLLIHGWTRFTYQISLFNITHEIH